MIDDMIYDFMRMMFLHVLHFIECVCYDLVNILYCIYEYRPFIVNNLLDDCGYDDLMIHDDVLHVYICIDYVL